MDVIKIGCIMVLIGVCWADDYYELLDVPRDASVREIRKAFKKLAVTLHPDKNQDDPEANEKFIKINKAYEVLKDEDLRKKYDMYGEAGLTEDGPSGRGFKSWNFYNQDFGIYDNDDEIITLTKMDFDQSVVNTNDIWFINYYSPQCSHCHDLAPTWRDVGRELDGVIRIGAVNCADEWMLCQNQGIRSYPTLIMYPAREAYHGDRTKKNLVQHALKQVGAKVIELWSGNYKSIMSDEERAEHPWVISFCGVGGDCMQRQTATKVAAMLSGFANVAEIDCHSNEKLCKKLGVDYGTRYFAAGEVKKGKDVAINSLDAKEIAFSVLEQLPDVTDLDAQNFKKALDDLQKKQDTPWLMHFVEGSHHDLELRKLPVLLSPMNIGRVDCRKMRDECNEFHMIHLPKFAVLKSGGGHEVHHGRMTANDIAAFAKDSAKNKVVVLGPADFPGRVVDSRDPWVVDFYAPWCPPCMRLLPEFRKASRQFGDRVQFGTVDCTIHQGLCQTYNIRSYPSTVFYNQSIPHLYHGHHAATDIVEFLQDTLQPPVITLDEQTFYNLVEQKVEGEVWMVDFYAPWCGPCQQLAPEWRRLAKMLSDVDSVKIGQVDCEAHKHLCNTQGVRSYPSVRLYPMGFFHPNSFFQYNGWYRDAPSLRAWAYEFLPSKTIDLSWETFTPEVLQSEEPWLVDFFAPWCGHCQMFAPEFERIAQTMEGRVKCGKVNCDQHEWLCRQAGIHAYPTVRFYAGTKRRGQQQSIYGMELEHDLHYLLDYLNRKFPKKKIVHDEF